MAVEVPMNKHCFGLTPVKIQEAASVPLVRRTDITAYGQLTPVRSLACSADAVALAVKEDEQHKLIVVEIKSTLR